MSNIKLSLFNTLDGQLQSFEPIDEPQAKQENRPIKVSMYVCGPTVYDHAHLGHARCYITWDVLYRFLKFLGYDVEYVRNITDVDDKILNRAKENGELPSELARRNYQSFSDDMKALNVLSPDKEPKATEYISQMIEGIQALIHNKAAYVTQDGSVYFRVSAKKDYGKLSKKPLDDLKAGARVEVDPNKESPLDFALWKAVSLGDLNGWESPWPAKNRSKGWGRPGWHMECSAMNHAEIGDQIDIHAGGADLIFPHHENEIAQSEAWTGKIPFAKYWLHNGFVNVSGEKMSKSLGNFSTIKALLKCYDANTIRYFLLTNHYRMPVDFNDEALQAAENWVQTRHKLIRETCKFLNWDQRTAQNKIIQQVDAPEVQKLITEGLQDLPKFIEEMAQDLNTPKALSTLNGSLSNLRGQVQLPDTGFSEVTDYLIESLTIMYHLGFDLNLIWEAVQLPQAEIQSIYQEITNQQIEADHQPEALLEALVSLRKQAKASKNWTQADAIRQQLTQLGLQLLDNKDGTTSVEKDGMEIVRV